MKTYPNRKIKCTRFIQCIISTKNYTLHIAPTRRGVASHWGPGDLVPGAHVQGVGAQQLQLSFNKRLFIENRSKINTEIDLYLWCPSNPAYYPDCPTNF